MLLAQEIDKYFTWRPAAEGEEWRVRLLIDHDPAHLNHKDGRFQRTALMTAAAYGHADIVRMLVEDKGAKMNIRDAHGFTALHLAAGMGHANVVAYLLAQGANASIKDQIGWTPLMTAARDGHLGVVRLLMAYKSQDVNEGNVSSKRTALWHAAEMGHEEVVRVLVCEGFADVTLCDREGKAPIQVAWERGHYDIAQFLEEVIGRSRPCVCLTPRYLTFQLRVRA